MVRSKFIDLFGINNFASQKLNCGFLGKHFSWIKPESLKKWLINELDLSFWPLKKCPQAKANPIILSKVLHNQTFWL